ncbi:hypothetical protein NGM37_03530, partial [Streptomyces sp. TRM76130]|nr:hypothetical protein [Streptomyces sp. TRM76130]
GLLGMRERVTAVGGVLTTGPRHGAGFRVHAILPVRNLVGDPAGSRADDPSGSRAGNPADDPAGSRSGTLPGSRAEDPADHRTDAAKGPV